MTGSDEAEEAPLGGPLAGPLGGPTGGSLPALLQLLENESEPLHNGNAPLAPSGITENLMHSFMQAYCGEVAGLPFDPPPTVCIQLTLLPILCMYWHIFLFGSSNDWMPGCPGARE